MSGGPTTINSHFKRFSSSIRPAEKPSVGCLVSSSERKRRHRISIALTQTSDEKDRRFDQKKGRSHTRKLSLEKKRTLLICTHLAGHQDKLRGLKFNNKHQRRSLKIFSNFSHTLTHTLNLPRFHAVSYRKLVHFPVF